MLVLWCPLSGTRKDIIMKDGFVILFFDVYGLNLYSGLMVSLLGQLLHQNGHKCGKMKLQFYDK
jgi:hypothetical protein